MSIFKSTIDHRPTLLDRRAHRKTVSKNLSSNRTRRHSGADFLTVPQTYLWDVGSGSFRDSEYSSVNDFTSGSLEELLMSRNSPIAYDDNYTYLSSIDYDREPGVLRRRHHRSLLKGKRRCQSASNLNHPSSLIPQWIVELRIYMVYDINTSIVRDGTNTCIRIKQGKMTLGRTTVKPSSSQQVWEQTFMIPLMEVDTPILLKFCSRKAGRFSTLGIAHLPLDECVADITYSKHLEIMQIDSMASIGMLRMQICLRPYQFFSPIQKKIVSLDESHKERKTRLHLKQRSCSIVNIPDTTSTKLGPLNAGVQIFEARYLGLLHLNVVSRPSYVYARRWSPLEYQPCEVTVITNPLTKATEIVSPRLPWPPHFLRGVSALKFDPVTGPQVAQFDSAVLYLNVLSACGLQSVPLSKFLNKCRESKEADDSVHRGVMVARMISYYQNLAKSAQPLSTQVQLQMGKDKYSTEIRKSTYDPVWNHMFTFYLTRSSRTLIEIQLLSIANSNISGPAAGIEKIGEALIDISRLPMDFTQRIEIELNGNQPKPRLLLLATLTGLAVNDSSQHSYALPSITLTSSGDSYGHQSDIESNNDSFKSPKRKISRVNIYSHSDSLSPDTEDYTSSTRSPQESCYLGETDAQIIEHYGWKMALKNRFDVGYLRVNVIGASGLTTKESNGKCDSFCLLELINMRVQTHTARKTLNPLWNKVFVFPVTDIHSVLYITVKEDEKSKSEFLGRVAIPLMKIRNHERSWYALKNAELTERSKGSILLEFFFVYNHFKAAWRTLNPIEACLKHPVRPHKYKKLSQEYKNAMQTNVMRLKMIFKPLGMVSQVVNGICSWENPWYTLAVLVVYNAVVWNFQPYMIPLGMIVGILASRRNSKNPYLLDVLSSAKSAAGVGASNLGPALNSEKILSLKKPLGNEDASADVSSTSHDCDVEVLLNNELLTSLQEEFPAANEDREIEKHTTESKDPKQGKRKINAIMDIIGDLPQIMDLIASIFEKTIGIFEWQVPWLTWFCLIFLTIFALILYFVPLRVVLCIIGTNQLTRKLLRPSSRYTFSTFNVISRVPSRPEAEQHRRLTPRSFVYPR